MNYRASSVGYCRFKVLSITKTFFRLEIFNTAFFNKDSRIRIVFLLNRLFIQYIYRAMFGKAHILYSVIKIIIAIDYLTYSFTVRRPWTLKTVLMVEDVWLFLIFKGDHNPKYNQHTLLSKRRGYKAASSFLLYALFLSWSQSLIFFVIS